MPNDIAPRSRRTGHFRNKLLALAVTGTVFASLVAMAQPAGKSLAVTIVHTNDWHANHQPQRGGDGGSARLAAVIQRIKADVKNVLLLDAGDRFTGTILHQKGGRENVPLMNDLGFHAMTLGNHEFDDGDEQLALFAKRVAFPLVSANLDASKSRDLKGLIKPYTIVEVNGHAFGVIGLTTANTKIISSPGKDLEFDRDYAVRVQAAADDLESKGVDKIIVLSHIGLDEDLKLAGQISKVDVIVGGHSHTVLSNMYKEARGVYPTIATDKDGKPVSIVQAGGGDGRYLGKLDLEFTGGVVTKAAGDCIHLSRFIAPDAPTQARIDAIQKAVDVDLAKPIVCLDGRTAEARDDFPGEKVRFEETAIGNLVTDAMRKRARADVAIINGGAIRAGMPAGPLTRGVINGAFPYDDTIYRAQFKGAAIVELIEHGLSTFTRESEKGRFLQVSGVKFTFDPTRPVWKRVVSVDVLGEKGYGPLDLDRTYTVAFDSFLWGGGDGYTMLKDKCESPENLGYPMRDVLQQYIIDHNPIRSRLEGRIKRGE